MRRAIPAATPVLLASSEWKDSGSLHCSLAAIQLGPAAKQSASHHSALTRGFERNGAGNQLRKSTNLEYDVYVGG
jgi:hypothetical protein